jgi:LysM repeat protein
MNRLSLLITGLLIPFLVTAQPQRRTTPAEYVQKYKDEAIKDMKKTGVPASITLAQGILESDAGNSDLAREANNHFGIKCHKEWTGPFFIKDDDTRDECFRKYKTVQESFDDHGMFLRTRPRYAFLFDLEITDYKGWAHGLKKAGYATNPRYAEILIRIIEEHELYHFDRGTFRKPVERDDAIAQKTTPPSNTGQPTVPKQVKRKHAQAKEKPARTSATSSHKVNEHQVPYVVAGKNDSWYSLAIAHDMRLWQILKYNDADKDDVLNEGEIVYLKPKRGRPQASTHTVVEGETLRNVSQKYGVKMRKLIKLNKMDESISIHTGQQIRLR